VAYFLVQYTYSPASAEARDQARPRHRSWVADQLNMGAVISSGPFADGTGALILVQDQDQHAVRRRFAEDPFAVEGLIEHVEITEWIPVLGQFAAE
jgi:uncharacterized protein